MSIARIKKNDTVIVISGVNAGKTGVVRSIDRKGGTAVVEGVNVHRKAVRRTETEQGGLIPREFPVRLCKLMPFDAEAKKGSRVATAVKDGKKVRRLKASGKTM